MEHTFATAALEVLNKNVPLVLTRIVARTGSAPRTSGARMLVSAEGAVWGTIGGGRCEAECIRASLDALRQGEADAESRILHFSLAGTTDMDMVCGGTLEILLEPLWPQSDSAFLLRRRLQAELQAEPHAVFSRLAFTETAFFGQGGVGTVSGVFVGEEEGRRRASEETGVPPELMREARAMTEGGARLVRLQDEHWLVEICRAASVLYFFGAGHVSRATAALAASVDFRTVVLDDREEFLTAERFPFSRTEFLPSLGEAEVRAFLERETPTAKDGLLILTRGHSHDRDVLRAGLETKAGYIGMIGSKSKRDAIYAALCREGEAREALRAVHCPIGLSIGAQSPEEIAVSIVAELVAWRAKASLAAKRI